MRSKDSWMPNTTTTHYQKLKYDLPCFQQQSFSGNRRIYGFQTEISSAAGVTIFSLPTSFILLVFLDHHSYDSTTIKYFTFSSPPISLNKEAWSNQHPYLSEVIWTLPFFYSRILSKFELPSLFVCLFYKFAPISPYELERRLLQVIIIVWNM